MTTIDLNQDFGLTAGAKQNNFTLLVDNDGAFATAAELLTHFRGGGDIWAEYKLTLSAREPNVVAEMILRGGASQDYDLRGCTVALLKNGKLVSTELNPPTEDPDVP